ncbi:MAG: hypothetical protein KAS39_04840 [Actinomycetia bacterium]|nr:hypothetical protein [Actinomycetes bacterium]
MPLNKEVIKRDIKSIQDPGSEPDIRETYETLVTCPDCGGNTFLVCVEDKDNPGNVKYIVCKNCKRSGILPTISMEAFNYHMDESRKHVGSMRKASGFNLLLAFVFAGLYLWKLIG